MPIPKLLGREDAPEAARPLMKAAERRMGSRPVPTGIQARCPPILEAGRVLGAAPGLSNTLPAELRGLVCVRVALMVTCPF